MVSKEETMASFSRESGMKGKENQTQFFESSDCGGLSRGLEAGVRSYGLKRKDTERKSCINFLAWKSDFILKEGVSSCTLNDFPPLSIHSRRFQSDEKDLKMIERSQVAAKSISRPKEKQPNPNSFLINYDFIILSPIRDNLLLTMALQNKENPTDSSLETSVYFQKEKKCRGKIFRERRSNSFVFLGRFLIQKPLKGVVLGYDAIRVATEPNAGGASIVSESLSMEYFSRRFGACNVVTEMEVSYINPNWKKVDYICEIYGQKFGVSVTRAMAYPDPQKFSEEKARALLHKKLYGLIIARSGIAKRHCFSKAILHVWCETYRTACIVQSQYDDMVKSLDMEDDVIMVLTIAEGNSSRPIFYESRIKEASSTCTNPDELKTRHPLWWLNEKPP